jgi:hypothetical protein
MCEVAIDKIANAGISIVSHSVRKPISRDFSKFELDRAMFVQYMCRSHNQ